MAELAVQRAFVTGAGVEKAITAPNEQNIGADDMQYANSAIRFYQLLRQLITDQLPSYGLSGEGEVEADES